MIASKKGVNVLNRGSQVHPMAGFQALLDFPPAPKLNVMGKLDPEQATESELRGQALFMGKANCVSCHTASYYTANSMHNLMVERFYDPRMLNGRMASMDGPIKTFPFRYVASKTRRRTCTTGDCSRSMIRLSFSIWSWS